MEKLAEFEFQTLTPSIIGGYDTGCYSLRLGSEFYERPRALAIKGSVRWWLRALLAGALWEAGRSKDEIEKQVGEKVGKIFGTSSGLATASGVVFRVHCPEWGPPRYQSGMSEKMSEIPRMKILTLGIREEAKKEWRCSSFPEGSEFAVSLFSRPHSSLSEKEQEVAVWALALYSVFGGVGAVTRRGFGALKVRRAMSPRFKRVEGVLNGFEDYHSINSDLIKRVVDEALSDAHALLGTSPRDRRETPPFPVLARSPAFKWEVKEVVAGDSIALLRRIGECTLKERWKRGRFGKGAEYNTWVLGLPRARKGEIVTGYRAEDQTERRASAIALKPLHRLDGRWKVLVFGFLSGDWPKLKHYSAKRRGRGWEPLPPRPVKTPVEEAFKEAWGRVLSLLEGGR